MPRTQYLPDVTRTVLQHRGSLSFPEESFVSKNSGHTGPSAKLRFSYETMGLFLLPCFQMAETNLFFVLFSGWRCPSQKLRTHLFWGINQNLPPSSQEPAEDVLPLWSPACLLQEGNLTSQAQLLSITMLKNLSKLPLYPFVSLILTGVLWALGTEIFMCIHCSLSFLWHPGVVCAPDRSNKLQELTTGLILKAREEGIALLLGLVYGFILYNSSMSTVNHFLLNVFFQLHFHMRLIAYSESNCSFHEELRALTVNKTILTSICKSLRTAHAIFHNLSNKRNLPL